MPTTNEELVFRTKVETGNSVKDTEKLTNSLKDTGKATEELGDKGSKALQELNDSVKAGNYTLGEAKTLISQYRDIALQAGKESPVGQEAIRMASQLIGQLNDLDGAIQGVAIKGQNLKAALELGSSLTAGYGALQGVMALTGTTNETLAETFVKLSAVQSILAGIEQTRASLNKDSLLVQKAQVVWTQAASAAQVIYTTVVGTTTGAMKALRIAMLAIPIVAIIAGIMALVSALAWFFSSAEKAEEMNNKVNESFDRQNKMLEANDRAFKKNADNKRKLMESELATAEELYEFDRKRIIEEEKNRKKSVSLLKETIPKKRDAYKQALEEENYELAATIKEEINGMRDKYTTFIEMDGQYAVDLKVLANQRRNELAKEREEEAKEAEKLRQDQLAKSREYAEKRKQQREQEAQARLEEQRLLEDLLAKNIEDDQARQLAEMGLMHSRELEELKKKYGEEHEIIKQAVIAQGNDRADLLEEFRLEEEKAKDEQALKDKEKAKIEAETLRRDEKADLEARLIMMREDFEITQELKAELALLEMEQALEQENLTEGEKFKIREEYEQKIDLIKEENAEKEKQRQQDVMDATNTVLNMGLSAAQGLSDAFFDYKIDRAEKGSAEELRMEKKKFETNKKLQIAQAIIQGVQGVQAAFASGSAIPIVGAVTGPAFAALAGITAALNVAKIANAKFDGGSASASSLSSTPSAPSVSIPEVQGQAPQEIVTATQGLPGSGTSQNNVTQVTLLQSELEESLVASQKVNVVSSVG